MKKEIKVTPTGLLELDLVVLYEVITGFFEAIIGIGLLTVDRQIIAFYEHARSNGLNEHHELFLLLISVTDRLVPFILSHRQLIGIFLLATATVKITSGLGLLFKKMWAHYLLEIYLILLIPIDGGGIIRHPTMPKVGFFLINIFILLYLSGFKTPKTIKHLYRYIFKKLRSEIL